MSKAKTSDCWYTPPEIIALIQSCLNGITLDPCADNGKHIEACQHFTVNDDGLSHHWFGRVFMNPPYSCPGVWIAKLQEEFNSGRVEEAIALVPASTDTKWFHPLIASNLICFWKGRIKFLDMKYQPKMSARQSHCLIYWGKNQSKFRQIFSPFGNFNFLEERLFKVGVRFEITTHKKYAGEKGYLSGYHTKDSPEFWVKLDNYDLQIRVFPNQVKFLEDEIQEEAIAPCQNSGNLTSAQELGQDSPLQPLNSEDLSLLDSQRLTTTAVISSPNDSQISQTTATYKDLLTLEHLDCSKSTSLQLPRHANRFQSKDKGLQQPMKETVSPQYLESSTFTNPDLQSSKMSPDYSAALTPLEIESCILTTLEADSKDPGTLSTGLSFQVVTLQPPLIEEDYCWLPAPTALSTKSSRPPGQSKLENFLKQNAIINKGQVVNPEFLESAYNLPIGWTDPQENRSASELIAEMEQSAIAAQPSVTPSIGESQPSDFAASCTSTPSSNECTPQSEPLVLCPSCELQHIYLSDGCGMCGLAPENFLEEKTLSANIECTRELQIGDRIRITKTRTQNLSQWIGYEATVTGINDETISVAAGEGREKKHLTLKKGWYEVIPENFLEESQPQQEVLQKPKGRQRKGCLYRYIENKKLKSGAIASYPRVIGHREQDNPTHWRWGYNWEEKIDGEWKGRSIGSVPVGAIPLIQSMQREGATLEEIIEFIRRSKTKTK